MSGEGMPDILEPLKEIGGAVDHLFNAMAADVQVPPYLKSFCITTASE
ncbi:MAG TPA: hypothetical protein VEK34_10745 [Methylocella sp.]|nr:hypothetical protein [Methylocella sp.]